MDVSTDNGMTGNLAKSLSIYEANPYVKTSTNDQGIIKIVDGDGSLYKTDGNETAKIIFTGGN